ncbi:uncharacterized protein [Dysidea avara]|uniref:uncharacterized protein n=1 Tax=Dysidea avara TaxID=196820 RepID=UPI00331985C2
MYCHFGQKWSKLHHGPLWSVTFSAQSSESSHSSADQHSFGRNPLQALVNIPGISERTIRRDIASSEIHLNSQIQLTVLDEAAKSNPDAWWWLKADGCDITKGLKESVKLQWSGDVDLNDGSLQKQCDAYNKRLKMAENAGLDRNQAGEDFKNILKDLAEDLNFLNAELIRSNDVYSEKLHSNKYNDKDLINLSWKLKELGDLNEMGRKLHSDIDVLSAKIGEHQHSWQQDNIPSQLKEIRTNLVAFIRGITRHQRTAATHILVFMISNEERRKKPYAIPVQCLPYKGLTDGRVRELSNKLIEEMTKRKMKVAGFTTDGEWNSLRMKGNTRPLSVLQIRSDVRRQYGHMKLQKMIEMITPVCDADGQCTACAYNPAVPTDLLKQVHGWFKTGATTDDPIDRLRLQTVPARYTFHTWIEGKDETKAEKLKSILAQLEYKHQVDLWKSKGVPFKEHLYVPEIHPKTGLGFCEREDEGHVLKRIGHSLRQGGNDDIQLERFEEALHDSSAGLTYTALSGVRKQSVEDVERLFSGSLVKWMENKGYKKEAEYLSVVHNWRRACDERGLTSAQRSKYNADFLSYLLDDLMPWHQQA